VTLATTVALSLVMTAAVSLATTVALSLVMTVTVPRVMSWLRLCSRPRRNCARCAAPSRHGAGGVMRDFLLRTLRVPPEPDLPPGDPRYVRTFRAGRGYYRYRLIIWLLRQAGTISGFVAGYFFVVVITSEIGLASRWQLFEMVGIAVMLAQIPVSFVVMKMNYELRWYMLTDRSLRIRSGILNVREQTMMFANVQNISVRQNPVQRIFGISNVAVRTAGGGSGGGGYPPGSGTQESGMHEAVFEGVDNAEEIRAVIRDRIRRQRDAGLRDPEDAAPPEDAGDAADPVLAAAHVLRDEARSLRAALAAD
jgi:membrane protein YdbS with pleckstrin-like domain